MTDIILQKLKEANKKLEEMSDEEFNKLFDSIQFEVCKPYATLERFILSGDEKISKNIQE